MSQPRAHSNRTRGNPLPSPFNQAFVAFNDSPYDVAKQFAPSAGPRRVVRQRIDTTVNIPRTSNSAYPPLPVPPRISQQRSKPQPLASSIYTSPLPRPPPPIAYPCGPYTRPVDAYKGSSHSFTSTNRPQSMFNPRPLPTPGVKSHRGASLQRPGASFTIASAPSTAARQALISAARTPRVYPGTHEGPITTDLRGTGNILPNTVSHRRDYPSPQHNPPHRVRSGLTDHAHQSKGHSGMNDGRAVPSVGSSNDRRPNESPRADQVSSKDDRRAASAQRGTGTHTSHPTVSTRMQRSRARSSMPNQGPSRTQDLRLQMSLPTNSILEAEAGQKSPPQGLPRKARTDRSTLATTSVSKPSTNALVSRSSPLPRHRPLRAPCHIPAGRSPRNQTQTPQNRPASQHAPPSAVPSSTPPKNTGVIRQTGVVSKRSSEKPARRDLPSILRRGSTHRSSKSAKSHITFAEPTDMRPSQERRNSQTKDDDRPPVVRKATRTRHGLIPVAPAAGLPLPPQAVTRPHMEHRRSSAGSRTPSVHSTTKRKPSLIRPTAVTRHSSTKPRLPRTASYFKADYTPRVPTPEAGVETERAPDFSSERDSFARSSISTAASSSGPNTPIEPSVTLPSIHDSRHHQIPNNAGPISAEQDVMIRECESPTHDVSRVMKTAEFSTITGGKLPADLSFGIPESVDIGPKDLGALGLLLPTQAAYEDKAQATWKRLANMGLQQQSPLPEVSYPTSPSSIGLSLNDDLESTVSITPPPSPGPGDERVEDETETEADDTEGSRFSAPREAILQVLSERRKSMQDLGYLEPRSSVDNINTDPTVLHSDIQCVLSALRSVPVHV